MNVNREASVREARTGPSEEYLARRRQNQRRQEAAEEHLRALLRGEPPRQLGEGDEAALISVAFQGRTGAGAEALASALLSHPDLSGRALLRIARREDMMRSHLVVTLLFEHPNATAAAKAAALHQLSTSLYLAQRLVDAGLVTEADIRTVRNISQVWGRAGYKELAEVAEVALEAPPVVREVLDTLLEDLAAELGTSRYRDPSPGRRRVRKLLGLAEWV